MMMTKQVIVENTALGLANATVTARTLNSVGGSASEFDRPSLRQYMAAHRIWRVTNPTRQTNQAASASSSSSLSQISTSALVSSSIIGSL